MYIYLKIRQTHLGKIRLFSHLSLLEFLKIPVENNLYHCRFGQPSSQDPQLIIFARFFNPAHHVFGDSSDGEAGIYSEICRDDGAVYNI